MFNLEKFISDSVTFRPDSMFEPDIKANVERNSSKRLKSQNVSCKAAKKIEQNTTTFKHL